jgi:hypothetical protein
MAREQKAGKKRKASNAKADQSLPKVLNSEEPCLSDVKRHKLGAVHGDQTLVEGPSAKRPLPILQWLQPSREGDARKRSRAEEGGEKRDSVEQYVQRWGTSTQLGQGGGRGFSEGGEMRAASAEKVSSSTGGEGVEEQRAPSAGVSENCAGQEALSISTAGSMTEEGLLGGVPSTDAGQEVGPLSPNTVYAHQLEFVKQAMCKEQGVPGSACDPQALNVYIAAKLEQLYRKAQGGGQQGESREGIPQERPPCGDHSAELLARIVVEVRKVVLGAAPLKGSILEQVRRVGAIICRGVEFSDPGVSAPACHVCLILLPWKDAAFCWKVVLKLMFEAGVLVRVSLVS